MKNISIVLNAVLVVAVGVLFYLQFAKPGTDAESQGTNPAGPVGKIAYIRMDSLMKNSELVKNSETQLTQKGEKLQAELRNRAMGLQSEIDNYQRTRGNLTISQDRAIAEDLTKKQQNLQLYEQRLGQDLMNEQAKLSKDLYDELTAYLKKYSEERGIEVVLKLDPSSDMLYGTGTLDITQDVVTGLNDLYKAGKSAAKPDSVATPAPSK